MPSIKSIIQKTNLSSIFNNDKLPMDYVDFEKKYIDTLEWSYIIDKKNYINGHPFNVYVHTLVDDLKAIYHSLREYHRLLTDYKYFMGVIASMRAEIKKESEMLNKYIKDKRLEIELEELETLKALELSINTEFTDELEKKLKSVRKENEKKFMEKTKELDKTIKKNTEILVKKKKNLNNELEVMKENREMIVSLKKEIVIDFSTHMNRFSKNWNNEKSLVLWNAGNKEFFKIRLLLNLLIKLENKFVSLHNKNKSLSELKHKQKLAGEAEKELLATLDMEKEKEEKKKNKKKKKKKKKNNKNKTKKKPTKVTSNIVSPPPIPTSPLTLPPTKSTIPSGESKSNLNVSAGESKSSLEITIKQSKIIERIKELYKYLMDKKIFNKYRLKRKERVKTLKPYQEHLLLFIKEILIPELAQQNINVVITGGFATTLQTNNKYKTEDIDMKLCLSPQSSKTIYIYQMRNTVKEIIKKNINFLNQNNHKLIFDLFEPSPNPLENNGDIPVKITGKVNVGKYKNTNNPTDFDAIGEITFTNTICNQNNITIINGLPVVNISGLIDNLMNYASNNFKKRMEKGERNIYPEKILGWMKQLQYLLGTQNPAAEKDLSRKLTRMKTPSPLNIKGGKRKTYKKRKKHRRTKKIN